MKSIFTFILTIAVIHHLDAKGTNESMTTTVPGVGGQFPHFGDQVSGNSGGGSSPSKVSLRLIGKTFAVNNGSAFIPVDSITYSYSNDRGGVLMNDDIDNDESLMYNESYKYTYNAGGGVYNPLLHRVQTYDAKNEVLSLTYSTWKIVKGSWAWKDSARYGYTYSNNKMTSSVLEQYYADMWTNDIKSDITYAGSKVESMESPVYKVAFTYDANNNLTSVIDQENNLGNWQFNDKHTYDYNGNNAMVTHTLETWNTGTNSWMNDKKWEYTYSGSDVTTEIESHWNGSSWEYYTKHTYSYDFNHNKLNDVLQSWNGSSFVNVSVETWEYNIQNLPTQITTNSWNGSKWVSAANDKQYRFYYENYFPASIVNVKDQSPVHVYPIPATDVLHVDLTLEKPASFTVAIYDMKGAVLRQWNEPGTTTYKGTFPVGDLPAGAYFIRVSNQETNITERFIVNR